MPSTAEGTARAAGRESRACPRADGESLPLRMQGSAGGVFSGEEPDA